MKNNILKKIISILITIFFILLLASIKSNAASLSISTSKSSVSPGESYTVTVTLSNGAGYVTSGGQTQWLDNSSFSYTKTAGSSGSDTISASGTAADYTTEQDQSVSASKTVTIVVPQTSSGGGTSSSGSSGKTSSGNSGTGSSKNTSTTKPTVQEETPKSSDNKLKELSIEQGTISPEFNPDTKEYSLVIPYEITEVSVIATGNDSKATVEVSGGKELQEGENTVTITVTAEDGSKADYVIKVIRRRVPIALSSLIIKYENKEGEIIETPLNPTFTFDNIEYTLEDLEYWVEKLFVEAVPNIEGTEVYIEGADNLQTGENTITITLKIASEQFEVAEDETEPEEETITYTIKVNKLEKPGFFARMSNWFKGLMGTIGTWSDNNKNNIIFGSLVVCIIALFGLSVYIVIDYKKYKDLLAKIKKVTEINNMETAKESKTAIITEDIQEQTTIDDNKDEKPKGGKRFK